MGKVRSIGIIGAGKLGIVVAQLALKAGYTVYLAGSGDPGKIALTTEVLTPGATATTNADAAARSDIVVLALPFGKFRSLPQDAFAGKLVIDAMNYWWEVDGPREDFIDPDQSSSEAVQDSLPGARVVKALNHMGYHDLHDEPKPVGAPGRKAIAVVGDDSADVLAVSHLIDTLGFDPLPIGKLSVGKKLEAGGKVFGANLEKANLAKLLDL